MHRFINQFNLFFVILSRASEASHEFIIIMESEVGKILVVEFFFTYDKFLLISACFLTIFPYYS